MISSPIVSSPCIQVCTLDAAGQVCLGCGRSLDEIARWPSMSRDERDRIMARLGVTAATLPTLSARTDGS